MPPNPQPPGALSARPQPNPRSTWDLVTLALWSIFFGVGLVPEAVFHALREAATISSYRALVNSSALITLSFSIYLGFFALRRCREAGLPGHAAQGKAIHIGIVGLVAFMDVPSRSSTFEVRTLLELLFLVGDLPDNFLRFIVIFVSVSKITAWLYLFRLVVRYHAFARRDTFARIPVLFRVARSNQDAADKQKQTSSRSSADNGDAIASPGPLRNESRRN